MADNNLPEERFSVNIQRRLKTPKMEPLHLDLKAKEESLKDLPSKDRMLAVTLLAFEEKLLQATKWMLATNYLMRQEEAKRLRRQDWLKRIGLSALVGLVIYLSVRLFLLKG